jgi:clathrin heavy chain
LNFFKDAIDTALESGKEQYVNALLKFFAERKDKESFAACLYTCYEFIKPDVAMELAWRYGMTEMCMPFMIQTMRDLTQKMNTMQMKSDIRDEKDKEEKKHESETPLDMNMFMGGNSLMIYQPGMQGNSGMGGMGMGGGMPGMNSGMGGFGNSGFGGNNNTGFGGNNNTGFGGNNSGFGFGQSQGMNNNNNNNMGMGGFGFGSNNNNQNNNQNNNTGFGF